MPVLLSAPRLDDLLPVPGVRIGVAQAGIRKANRKDLTVFLLDERGAVGAVFTRNRYAAAPVQVCREHLAAGQGIRANVEIAAVSQRLHHCQASEENPQRYGCR